MINYKIKYSTYFRGHERIEVTIYDEDDRVAFHEELK